MLWASKVVGIPISKILELGVLGQNDILKISRVQGQNDIWVQSPWLGTEGGRWWLPPSPGRGEFYEIVFTHGLFVHQKCSNYAITNLLFGLCKFL
jgi:hypothetical protein